MTADPMGALAQELLLLHLDTWVPAALRQARRATFIQAYQGPDAGTADAALRAVAGHGDLAVGRQLSVVTLAGSPAGVAQPVLPATVSAHLLPGGPSMIPVAVTAATAARAPLLCYVDLDGGPSTGGEPWRSVNTGRPAEVLIVGASNPPDELRAELIGAGSPLVNVVELSSERPGAPADARPYRIAFATGSGKRIEAFKDALWAVDAPAGTLLRSCGDDGVPTVSPMAGPDLAPLRGALLAHLATGGRRTVAELRSFAVTATVYRAGDVNSALAELLADDAVRREPADGRLGGDVSVWPMTPAADPPARSTV
jgi:hypothetical protein